MSRGSPRSACTFAWRERRWASVESLIHLAHGTTRVAKVEGGQGHDQPAVHREKVSSIRVARLLVTRQVMLSVVLQDDLGIFVDQIPPSDEVTA